MTYDGYVEVDERGNVLGGGMGRRDSGKSLNLQDPKHGNAVFLGMNYAVNAKGKRVGGIHRYLKYEDGFKMDLPSGGGLGSYAKNGGPGDPPSKWSTTMAALAISGLLVADDATGVGVVDDVAIPFLLAGAVAADLYKRQPNGTQYTLRANTSGVYPIYSWGSSVPTGTKYLNAGDIWKIGETIQYDASTGQQWRYTQSYLNSMNVSFVSEYLGPKTEIVFVQQMKLAQYLYSNGVLPAGNKGLK